MQDYALICQLGAWFLGFNQVLFILNYLYYIIHRHQGRSEFPVPRFQEMMGSSGIGN